MLFDFAFGTLVDGSMMIEKLVYLRYSVSSEGVIFSGSIVRMPELINARRSNDAGSGVSLV